ncbi:aldo/keto reductase [Opitutus sp. GAS368]|uniref:aldo/keto reductase n=1 Tax=Opitutus sp. GAS368 TaxID=1882749 RepID=UPI00087B1CD5|nr:aldo/keto reductase [Opitutus sp. GAS368]SDS47145.1 Predicted oxidoreductase [Opitutus sp. GAS368]
MSPRSLGCSGLTVSRLGLGCTTFGREISEAEAFALMDYALANGITLFDTAEAYGGGQARAYRRAQLGIDDTREVSGEMHSSEKIIGRWFRARGTRDRITLVTKVTRDFRAGHVRQALEASLARLQTDHADLYLYHSFDPASPVEEAAIAIDSVIRAGLTRAGGCSNHSGPQLQAALEASRSRGLHGFTTLQLPYNLLQNAPEALPIARQARLGIMAYSPLAAGFLSGKYTPDRATMPKGSRFDVIPAHADIYFTERNFRRVQLLHRLAQSVGVPALQLALAWVLRDPLVDTVLVGARTQAQLDNALAAQRLELNPEWLAGIATWDDLPHAQV